MQKVERCKDGARYRRRSMAQKENGTESERHKRKIKVQEETGTEGNRLFFPLSPPLLSPPLLFPFSLPSHTTKGTRHRREGGKIRQKGEEREKKVQTGEEREGGKRETEER